MKVRLHPHQQDAVAKMHNGCVLWGGVGTGKTITALAYALEKEPERKIIVITTAKKRNSFDWEDEAAKLMIRRENIVVESWNNINKFTEHENFFFIFDEQRLVGAGAWVKAFYKIAKKNRWILLSATPGDTWSDYAPMFIANGWYKNITEFRREHAIYSTWTTYPKIERWVNEGKLQKYRKQLLVHMPMMRHTRRHMHHVECEYDQETLDLVRKRRWNVYTDEPIQNAAELFGVMRKVVATDPSRARQIQSLIKKHPKLIVFYNFDYELELLRDLCRDLERSLNKKEEEPWESTMSMILRAMERTDLSPEQKQDRWSGLLKTDSPTAPPLSPRNGTATRRHPSRTTRSSRSDAQPERTASASSKSTVDRQLPTAKTSAEPPSSQTAPQSNPFGWAEYNGHKHEELPKTDLWLYLVQYQAGSESWNCTETDAMAFWSLTYSYKQFHQSQGRIDRLNTPYTDLHYYVLMTDSYAEKPVMAALAQKKDFQPR